MYGNERYSTFRNDDFEDKEELDEKQHLSDVELQKLRSVIKTKIAGELTISENDVLEKFKGTEYCADDKCVVNKDSG
jgi:hypothetical protein